MFPSSRMDRNTVRLFEARDRISPHDPTELKQIEEHKGMKRI